MSNPDDIYDEWLVLRCQGGDSKALAILVQRWQPRLLGFAIRLLRDRDAAEDAVQSSWVGIVRRINSIKDPKSLRPWLFRIVANKCSDLIRRRSSRRKYESEAEEDQIPDPAVSEQCARQKQSDQVTRLRVAIRSLDKVHQQILQLHYLKELSIQQIANQLSIPLGTVKSRLHHARVKLRQSLPGDTQ